MDNIDPQEDTSHAVSVSADNCTLQKACSTPQVFFTFPPPFKRLLSQMDV